MLKVKPIYIILLVLFFIQLALISYSLPIYELWSEKPFLHVDSPYHIYQISIANQLGKEGLLAGYDPLFSSGYVAGVSKNHSAHFPAFFSAFLFSDINPIIVYKFYYFLSACAAAIMIPIAASVLGAGTMATALSGTIGVLLWWNSDLRITHNSGMVSSVLSAYWGVAFGALLLSSCKLRFDLKASIMIGLVGALGLMYYPFFPIIVAFIVIPGIIILRNDYNLSSMLYHFSTVIVIAIIVNLFWIIPTFSDHQLAYVSKSFSSKPDIGQLFYLTFGRMTIINGAILISTCYAALFIENIKYKRFSWIFLSAGLITMLYGSLGAYIPAIAKLQSNRFLPFSFIVMAPATGLGIMQMIDDVKCHTGFRKLATYLMLIGLGLIGLNLIRETWQEISYANVPRRGLYSPEVRGEGPATTWLREWIETNTTDDSRILFEHSGNPVYDRAYISSYLGMKTNREFANYNFQLQVPSGFGNGWLHGRDINDYSIDELQQLLWTHNVGLVITAEQKTANAFKNVPTAKLVANRGSINLFRIEHPPGLFIKGSGKLSQRDLNKLVFNDLTGDDVIIRYNYYDCLKTSPVTPIEPISLPLAPYPFIRLRNPPNQVTIACF